MSISIKKYQELSEEQLAQVERLGAIVGAFNHHVAFAVGIGLAVGIGFDEAAGIFLEVGPAESIATSFIEDVQAAVDLGLIDEGVPSREWRNQADGEQ